MLVRGGVVMVGRVESGMWAAVGEREEEGGKEERGLVHL